MDEHIPKQPNFSILDMLHRFNTRQIYIKIKNEVVDKDHTKLFIEKTKNKFASIKDDKEFIITKDNANEAKNWINDWEKEIIKYIKGRNLIEKEIIDEKEIKIWLEKKNKILEDIGIHFRILDMESEYIVISLGVVDGYRITEYAFEFNNEDELKLFIEEMEKKIRASESLNSIVKQIESINTPELDKKLIEKHLKIIEDKWNTFIVKNRIGSAINYSCEIDKQGEIKIIVRNDKNEITDTKNFKNIDEAFRSIKLNANSIDKALEKEQKIIEQQRIKILKKKIEEIETSKYMSATQIENLLKTVVEKFNISSEKLKIDTRVNKDKSITVFLTTINKNQEFKSETTYKTLETFMKWIKAQKVI